MLLRPNFKNDSGNKSKRSRETAAEALCSRCWINATWKVNMKLEKRSRMTRCHGLGSDQRCSCIRGTSTSSQPAHNTRTIASDPLTHLAI